MFMACLPINTLIIHATEDESEKTEEDSISTVISNEEIQTENTSEPEYIIEYADPNVYGSLFQNSSNFKTFAPIAAYNEPGISITAIDHIPIFVQSSLADGVYSLKNIGNSNCWMGIQSSKIDPGYHVWQKQSTACPIDSFDRSCMFKITKVKNAERYIIRSMLNNRLSFGFNGSNVITKEIPPNDADVNINDTFVIQYDSLTGYISIQPYGYSNYVISPNSGTTSGAYLYKKTNTSASNQGFWQLYKYSGDPKSGISLPITPRDMSYGVKLGETFTIKLITWSTVIGANTPYITQHPDYPDMAVYSMDTSNYTITVTPIKEGPLGIRAVIRYDGTTNALLMYRPMWTIIPEFDGQTAFIQNVGTGKYIDLESASMSEGGIIQQWAFHTGTQAQWVFEIAYGGFFYIKSLRSGMYVGIDPSNNTSVKQYAAKSNYTTWRLKKTTSGNFTFANYMTESSGVVLSAPTSTSGNGDDLTMLAYVSDTNYRDEWKIKVPCNNSYSLDLQSHAFNLNTSGFYVCDTCDYSIPSPILEDAAVLSREDYCKVESLYLSSLLLWIYYKTGIIAGNYAEYAYIVPLEIIDDVRAKSNYSEKYSYKLLSGNCCDMFSYAYESILPEYGNSLHSAFIQKECDYYDSISSIQASYFNGDMEDFVYFILGISSIFISYDHLNALLYSAQSEGFPDVSGAYIDSLIDLIPDKNLKKAVSLFYSIINYPESDEDEVYCVPGDDVVNISLVDNVNHSYSFGFAFNSNGEMYDGKVDLN